MWNLPEPGIKPVYLSMTGGCLTTGPPGESSHDHFKSPVLQIWFTADFLQFSSVAKLCPTLCNPMDYSMPDVPVHHQPPEFTQTHVHWVCNAIQPSHPLSSPFTPAFNLSQHQGLFKQASASHQVANVLKFQLQNLSFQWIFRTDFL